MYRNGINALWVGSGFEGRTHNPQRVGLWGEGLDPFADYLEVQVRSICNRERAE